MLQNVIIIKYETKYLFCFNILKLLFPPGKKNNSNNTKQNKIKKKQTKTTYIKKTKPQTNTFSKKNSENESR